MSDNVRRDLRRLLTERFDPMPGLSSAEKKARLARMSYTDFVTKLWKLEAAVLRFYQTRTHSLFGVGVDAVPAQDGFALGLPGFSGMGLDPGPPAGTGQRVEVTYLQNGNLKTASGRSVVLAYWHVIPSICPEHSIRRQTSLA